MAEAQAAIADAAAAEQATATAQANHRDAVQTAARADPGTPAATPPVYTDPGAADLVSAQTRLVQAQAKLLAIGDEVAAQIRAAAGSTSNARPETTEDGWDAFWNSPLGRGPLLRRLPTLDSVLDSFFHGAADRAWEEILAGNDTAQAILPGGILIRDTGIFLANGAFNGGLDAVHQRHIEDAQNLIAVAKDPLGTLRELWRGISAEDLWATDPARATGQVTVEALTFFLPVGKISKVSKIGKTARINEEIRLANAARAADAATSQRLIREATAKAANESRKLAIQGVMGARVLATQAAEKAAKEAADASLRLAAEAAEQKSLIDQVLAIGDKISPTRVVMITKTPDGKIFWLARGKLDDEKGAATGLAHIIEDHGEQFAQKGIKATEIPDFLKLAVTNGKVSGEQSAAGTRTIFEVEHKGKTQKVAITIGNNGYIVGANPRS